MPTRAQLEKAAAKADRDHRKWLDRAELAEKTRAVCQSHAEALARYRDDLLRMAGEAGTNEVLHKRLRPSSVNEPMMDKDHRLAISKGHSGEADAFAKAIRAKGFSQNSLAKRVGLNQAVLSLHRRSLRRIKRSKAEAIEKITGWPADARHWPCGIVSDGE